MKMIESTILQFLPCKFHCSGVYFILVYNMQCTAYSEYIPYSVHYTVYIIQYLVYSILYTVHNIQYTDYRIQNKIYTTVHSVQYTVYNIQCGAAQGDQLVLSVATERGSQVFALPSQRQIARYSQIPGTVRYQVQSDKKYSKIPGTAR